MKSRIDTAVVLALAGLAVALAPLLFTPRVSDDVINYSFRWLSGADFYRVTLDEMRNWILSTGRVFVFSTLLKNFVFLAFETTLAYKLFLFAMNLACAATFFAYARLVSRSALVPLVALLALPVLVQLRDYHDPIISFNGLFQISAMLTFAGLAFHHRYLKTGKGAWLGACAGSFVVNLLFYEIAALTLALIVIQEWTLQPPGRRKYRGTLVLGVIFAAYLALVVASRMIGAQYGHSGSPYGVAAMNVGLVAGTFAKQLIAVVPFTYPLFKPRNGAWDVQALPEFSPWLLAWPFYAAALFFVVTGWLALRKFRHGEDMSSPEGVRTLGFVGAALIVLPAMLIAAIRRYQGAFELGNGYSFVYLQVFGAALVIAVAFLAILRRVRAKTLAMATFCAVMGLAAAGNLVNNRAVAASLALQWSPQFPWAAMLRSPQFRSLCGDVGLAVIDPAPWSEYRVIEHAGFRSQRAGESVFCVVRTAALAGRYTVAYARARLADGGEAHLVSPVHVVWPLHGEEAPAELPGEAACAANPGRLQRIDAMTFAAGRFALYTTQSDRPLSKGFCAAASKSP